ncbi:DUF4097 family beta strand repeat-containing protein [Streptomyces indicus]|uniref:Putative adhesin n=1 Tax=Streptomyces indicus TaxID=417292 RepID=A0A1G9IMX8_9ACTN|nr:DUF4097 family beta strand repeat-containing protein [Streptomyces indicus]SDL26521.1 Putative adhesin [Streptomyces indicus]
MSVRTARLRSRRVWVAAGAVAGVLVISGCSDVGDDADPEVRNFALQGRQLTVDSEDSALDLVVGDGDEVRVTRWFDGSTVIGEDPKISWEMVGGKRLVLRVECDGVVSSCESRHRIEVPRGVAVNIDNQDGRVNASGFTTALKIKSNDGRVVVKESSGSLDLDSRDGAVEVVGGSSRQIRAHAQDGRVELALGNVPDRVDVRSKDGSVEIGLPEASYNVKAEARDGSVEVDVPRDASSPHVVSAVSEDGRVRVHTV